jgi:hypothetical protein
VSRHHQPDERIPLLDPPYQVELKGWSPDCDYDHEIKIGIGILPPQAFTEYQLAESNLEEIREWFELE